MAVNPAAGKRCLEINGIEIMTPATPGVEDAAQTPFSDLLAISLLDAHVP